jgi:hypothetical protein
MSPRAGLDMMGNRKMSPSAGKCTTVDHRTDGHFTD